MRGEKRGKKCTLIVKKLFAYFLSLFLLLMLDVVAHLLKYCSTFGSPWTIIIAYIYQVLDSGYF